jgi:hypothetical protein
MEITGENNLHFILATHREISGKFSGTLLCFHQKVVSFFDFFEVAQ